MRLSSVGVWSAALRFKDPAETAEVAAELEELGYTSLWIPDQGRGVFEAVEHLLASTRTATIATGILNIWGYAPEEVGERAAALRASHGDRLLLGLGVSHAPSVERMPGDLRYEKPLQVMTRFLDGLDAAPTPLAVDDRVIAALGPKMLEIAAHRAGGVHPYNVTPEHTAIAREALGPSKQVLPEQGVALASTAEEGRRIGREFLEHYLGLPNYANNLRRLGFDEDDLAGGGSDRLVDAVIAWGDEEAIADRVRAHLDAGADSVCIQLLGEGGMVGVPRDGWRRLAPVLTAL